jgi:hypothetical protein
MMEMEVRLFVKLIVVLRPSTTKQIAWLILVLGKFFHKPKQATTLHVKIPLNHTSKLLILQQGPLPAPSCSPGTSGSSKVVGDATYPAQAFAAPLHFRNNTIGISGTPDSSSKTRNSTKPSTRYHQTLDNPEFLSLINSSVDSGVELRTETEVEQGQKEAQDTK